MAECKIRLTEERDELKDRFNSLYTYLDEIHAGVRTQDMSDYHMELMYKQLKAMKKYLTMLNARIGDACDELPVYKRN